MPVPSLNEMVFLSCAAGTAQLLFTLHFCSRILRRRGTPARAARVPVTVIVPCKGIPDELEKNIFSLLEQDYPGEAEYLFVVPSPVDPAFRELQAILAKKPEARSRLLSSGAAPAECSEKILNMLYGYEHAREISEILVFADCDVAVSRGWLTGMVRPLEDPKVAVTTAHALPMPAAGDFWGQLMKAWVSAGIPYMAAMGMVSGCSIAMRRGDFLLLGVEKAWRTSLCEDLTLTRLAQRAGKKVYFAHEVMPYSRGAGDMRQVFGVLNRWMVFFRFYARTVWLSGALLTAFKFYTLWWALSRADVGPAAVVFSADLANLFLLARVFEAHARREPENQAEVRGRGSLRTALSCSLQVVPLQIIYAVNFLSSAVQNKVRWAGRFYRLRSAGRVEVIPYDEPV